MGDVVSQILEFLAHVGGFLAFIVFVAFAVKFWRQAEAENDEKEFEDD